MLGRMKEDQKGNWAVHSCAWSTRSKEEQDRRRMAEGKPCTSIAVGMRQRENKGRQGRGEELGSAFVWERRRKGEQERRGRMEG